MIIYKPSFQVITQLSRHNMANTENITVVGRGKYPKKYFGSILANDGNIYIIPHDADRFERFNPMKEKFEPVGGTLVGGLKKFFSGVIHPVDKCIYTVPFNNRSIVKFDPDTNKVTYIPKGVKQMKAKWIDAVVANNNHIYFIPYCHDNVLKLNVTNKQCTIVGSGSESVIRGKDKYNSGGLGSDGNIYCIPRNASYVLKIDVQENKIERFGEEYVNHQFSGCVATQNGDIIYAAPFEGTKKFLKIDVVNQKTSLVSETHGSGWRDIVQATDGMIYVIPYDAKQVFKFDPRNEDEHVKPFGNFFHLDNLMREKWKNVVRGKDGCIYAGYRDRILKVMPSNPTGESVIATIPSDLTINSETGNDFIGINRVLNSNPTRDSVITTIPSDLTNDSETGNDCIGIKQEAAAIAQLLTLNELETPFTVGLLGRWGTGKSFMFNQIKNEIIEIQKSYTPENASNYDYAGHIYVVKFDAWTYSKGNIWSSLMFTILSELNKQVQIEDYLKNVKGPHFFKESVIQALDKLESNELEFLQMFPEIIIEKDVISESLAKAINIAYEDLKKELTNLEQERSRFKNNLKALKEMEKMNRNHKDSALLWGVTKNVFNNHRSDIELGNDRQEEI